MDTWRAAWLCAALGLLTSVIFTFLLFPRIAGSLGAVLDPDGHGALAWGLFRFHTFSLFPSTDPVVTRGPLYPFVLASILAINPAWWPQSAQVVQDLFFSATCYLTCRLGQILWNPAAGLLAGALCALNPFLVWYTSRIWVEALTILLFTAIVLAAVQLQRQPSLSRGILLGGLIAAAALCKGTFVPFVFLVPVVLWILRPRPTRSAPILAALFVAVLLIAPWTVRNWVLTHHFIPVHGLMGFNLRTGDVFVQHIKDSPWSFLPQWRISTAEVAGYESTFRRAGLTGWQLELAIDNAALHTSLATYAADPLFLPRKMLINTATYWAWSETRQKTIAVALLNLPLLAAFCYALFRTIRTGTIRAAAVPVALICAFYFSYLPILAMARYSAPVIPSMLAFSAGLLRNRTGEAAA